MGEHLHGKPLPIRQRAEHLFIEIGRKHSNPCKKTLGGRVCHHSHLLGKISRRFEGSRTLEGPLFLYMYI